MDTTHMDLTTLSDEQLAALGAGVRAESDRRRAAKAPDPVQIACAIATGQREADPDATGVSVRASHRDLNAKGNGPEWHRLVWRDGAWGYFSDERLPPRGRLAAQRRCTVRGDVFAGEIVVDHDRGGPVDAAYLVVPQNDKPLKRIKFKGRRDGKLAFALPDGSEVVLPNPRKR